MGAGDALSAAVCISECEGVGKSAMRTRWKACARCLSFTRQRTSIPSHCRCICFSDISFRTRSGSSVVLDGGTLAVEGIVGSALESGLGGELATTELARHGGSQLCGCASGEHCVFWFESVMTG